MNKSVRLVKRHLPDGTFTTSKTEYLNKWHELIEQLEKLFPGYTTHSYDPGFRLERRSKNRFGQPVVEDSFEFSVMALYTLLRQSIPATVLATIAPVKETSSNEPATEPPSAA